ncbi:hypothetical protein BDV12DRAFT_199466 [Aspergillus spectabilis]
MGDLSIDFYSSISTSYEKAYGHDPSLLRFIHRVMDHLPPKAYILDTGSTSISSEPFPEFLNNFAEYITDTTVADLDTEARLAKALQDNVSCGAYNQITNPTTFAARVSSDIQALTGDKHFRCFYGIPPDEHPAEVQSQRLEKLNYGFGDVKFLPGNIATLDIKGFVPIHWEGVKGLRWLTPV